MKQRIVAHDENSVIGNCRVRIYDLSNIPQGMPKDDQRHHLTERNCTFDRVYKNKVTNWGVKLLASLYTHSNYPGSGGWTGVGPNAYASHFSLGNKTSPTAPLVTDTDLQQEIINCQVIPTASSPTYANGGVVDARQPLDAAIWDNTSGVVSCSYFLQQNTLNEDHGTAFTGAGSVGIPLAGADLILTEAAIYNGPLNPSTGNVAHVSNL